MTALFIGLNGEMEAGKNFAADMIAEIIDEATGGALQVRQYAFATLLKVSAMKSLGFTGTDDELVALANKLKEQGHVEVKIGRGKSAVVKKISGREYLQYKGTEGGRDVFGQDFWVDLAMSEVEPTGIALFTDTRFPNECHAVRSTPGGRIWKLIGPPKEETKGKKGHDSEQTLPAELIDFTIDNTRRDDDGASLREQLTRLIVEHPAIDIQEV